jgi:hypothetical protein
MAGQSPRFHASYPSRISRSLSVTTLG